MKFLYELISKETILRSLFSKWFLFIERKMKARTIFLTKLYFKATQSVPKILNHRTSFISFTKIIGTK